MGKVSISARRERGGGGGNDERREDMAWNASTGEIVRILRIDRKCIWLQRLR